MSIDFDLNVWIILQLFVLPVLLPLIVGLVTKFTTSGGLKSMLLLALAGVSAVLTQLLNAYQNGSESFNLGEALMLAFITFITAVGMHYGLLKPTGATATVQAIGSPKE